MPAQHALHSSNAHNVKQDIPLRMEFVPMEQCALQIVLNALIKTIVWFVSLDIID